MKIQTSFQAVAIQETTNAPAVKDMGLAAPFRRKLTRNGLTATLSKRKSIPKISTTIPCTDPTTLRTMPCKVELQKCAHNSPEGHTKLSDTQEQDGVTKLFHYFAKRKSQPTYPKVGLIDDPKVRITVTHFTPGTKWRLEISSVFKQNVNHKDPKHAN